MTPSDLSKELQISIYVTRDTHENGMTLKEYADAVMAGKQPVLDHSAFFYQFNSLQEHIDQVADWATKNGLEVIEASPEKATVKIKGRVGSFNVLFGITLEDETDGDRTYITHTGEYKVPSEIIDVVENILGFDQSFFAVKNAVPYDIAKADFINPLVAVTPQNVASCYGLPSGDGNGGCIGIFELTTTAVANYLEGWQQPDVTASFTRVGLTAPTIVTVNVDSGQANWQFSSTSTSESMLDIYCAGAVAPKAKIAYYIGLNGGTAFINDVINAAVADTTNKPSVLSISWGIGDGTQFDTAFQACIALGITPIVSSGDSGSNNLNISASCCSQYAILAGGTTLNQTGGVRSSETAWSGSGGGISGSVTLPAWQSGLTSTTKTSGGVLGAPTALPRRAIPDFSAPADPTTGFQFYTGGTNVAQGTLVQYGGTSASAPFLAGMIVRLNVLLGYRIGLPMSTFYSNSGAFTDITSGDNVNGLANGYTTTSGWDAVTGLGVPLGSGFYKLFRTGTVYPKRNYSFRPTTGVAYPRLSSGAR